MAAPATAMSSTPPPGLSLDFLPFVDMTTLTHSELRALSLSSSSSFDLQSTDNMVIPTIDRSAFNESAGSGRQTYSRPSHHHHRHRIAGLLPKAPNPPNPSTSTDPSTDPDRLENRSIIKFLKQFLSSHPEFQQSDFYEFDSFSHFNNPVNFMYLPPQRTAAVAVAAAANFRKRKRGRKPKVKILSAEERERAIGLEIVNKNGLVVDLVRLASMEDPYKEELKRRTVGMEGEEELLGFFRDLGGQWCSRRRKRKIVDASEFGDTLPVGWKLLLGLKRKEGHAWVYCRRYISPGGQHFMSCKDVSEYLQSYFGSYASQQAKDHAGHNIQQDHGGASESHVGAIEPEEGHIQSNECKKEISLLGIENLAEVQIQDLFECHKCNMTFDEKDAYLQHLLSFHHRTTRRYRLGSSVGDGVIVKDGKYECQFCHKVFHERRRYNGHVGIHVRNYVRGIEESPMDRMVLQNRGDSPITDELPARISKMDALIEIAQNSIRETSPSGPIDVPIGGLTFDKQIVVSNDKLPASVSDHELESDSHLSEPEMEDGVIAGSLEPELHQPNGDNMVIDNVVDVKMVASSVNVQQVDISETLSGKDCLQFSTEIHKPGIVQERASESNLLTPMENQRSFCVDVNIKLVGTDRGDCLKPDETDIKKNNGREITHEGYSSVAKNGITQDTMQQSFKENIFQYGNTETSMPPPHPPHAFPMPNAVLDKGEKASGKIDQRHEKTEKLKFSFGTEQESLSLSEVRVDLEDNNDIKGTHSASTQFQSEVIDTSDRQHHMTVCVWCGVEFSYEAVDTEIQSGSVGYMCPTCKAKIS